MALEKAYDDKWGNSHPSAYFRVERISLDVKSDVGEALVCVYKDQTARNTNKEVLTQIKYTFKNTNGKYDTIFGVTAMENKNPIKGIYTEIKTYPEFDGAIDV